MADTKRNGKRKEREELVVRGLATRHRRDTRDSRAREGGGGGGGGIVSCI